MSSEQEDEPINKDDDCGVFSVELPQDLYVLTRRQKPKVGDLVALNSFKTEVLCVFCNPDYAKLYAKWCEQKSPGIYDYDIQETKGNPPKKTIEEYD
jgi:hypothetical protein